MVLAALAVAGTSCTGSSDGGTAPAAPAAATTTATPERTCTDADPGRQLEVWHATSDMQESVLKELLARFVARTGVNVNATHHSSYAEIEDLLRRTRPQNMPDLVLLSQERVRELADSGRFVPAQRCIDATGVSVATQLFPVVHEAFSSGGALQAVPYGASFPVLYYSPRRLAQIGVGPPTKPAELRTALERLRDAGVPAAMRYDPQMPVALAEQWAAQRGAPLVAAGADGETVVRFDNPDLRRDLEWLRDLDRDGLAALLPAGADDWDDAAAVADETNPAAFAIHSSRSMGQARAFIEAGRYDADRALVAAIPAQGTGVSPGGDGWWIGASPTNNPRRSFELAAFLLEPPQQARVGTKSGYVSVNPAASNEPLFSEDSQRFPQLREPIAALSVVDDPARVGRTAVGGRRELRDVLLVAADAIRRGEDPGAALARAQREATSVIEAYRRSRRPR